MGTDGRSAGREGGHALSYRQSADAVCGLRRGRAVGVVRRVPTSPGACPHCRSLPCARGRDPWTGFRSPPSQSRLRGRASRGRTGGFCALGLCSAAISGSLKLCQGALMRARRRSWRRGACRASSRRGLRPKCGKFFYPVPRRTPAPKGPGSNSGPGDRADSHRLQKDAPAALERGLGVRK